MGCIICFILLPKSTASKIILRPKGKIFINGLASSYEDSYPSQLKKYIDEFLYKKYINELNATILTHWPCRCALLIGYICCIFTIGLSFLIPYLCIKDSEGMLLKQIKQYNNYLFLEKGFIIKLKKRCCFISWLEIKILENAKKQNNSLLETDIENG